MWIKAKVQPQGVTWFLANFWMALLIKLKWYKTTLFYKQLGSDVSPQSCL